MGGPSVYLLLVYFGYESKIFNTWIGTPFGTTTACNKIEFEVETPYISFTFVRSKKNENCLLRQRKLWTLFLILLLNDQTKRWLAYTLIQTTHYQQYKKCSVCAMFKAMLFRQHTSFDKFQFKFPSRKLKFLKCFCQQNQCFGWYTICIWEFFECCSHFLIL